MNTPTTIEERARHLVYGNIDDLRCALQCGGDDIAVLREARQLAGSLGEGATKCRLLDRAIAKLTPSQPMPKGNHSEKSKAALAVINDPSLKTTNQAALERLQKGVLEEIKRCEQLDTEVAARRIVIGLTLHRIKASCKHGEWLPWLKANVNGVGYRACNYAMRLAAVFVEVAKVDKPALLALPGDQLSLAAIEEGETGKQLLDALKKFIGTATFSDLLDKHGIKETKALGGKREPGETEAAEAPSAEELYHQSRDEIGLLIERGETLFLKENRLQYLAGHPEEIAGTVKGLRDLADKVERAAQAILKSSDK